MYLRKILPGKELPVKNAVHPVKQNFPLSKVQGRLKYYHTDEKNTKQLHHLNFLFCSLIYKFVYNKKQMFKLGKKHILIPT